ncbi:MAG: hypothetical protein JJT78_04395 [Leptospira sp.]|nr:hypothetical protein [Leptospira sp.]
MTPKEAGKINRYLSKLSGISLPSKIFIDNLHYPYFEFSEYYSLPTSSSLDGMDFNSSMEYIQEISRFIPELISNSFILPEPKPKKETGKIFLVRQLSKIGNQSFIWVLTLEATYLGGAEKSNILQPARQGRTTSIRTNRIYFKSFAIPVESILRERDEIRGFDPYEIRELLTDIASGNQPDSRIKPYSELFDEADYSEQEKTILNIYSINSDNWKPGNVYKPLGMDYLSLSVRFLEKSFSDIESIWSRIGNSIWINQEKGSIPSSNNENFIELHEYLRQIDFRSDQSPSGNLRWEIYKKI